MWLLPCPLVKTLQDLSTGYQQLIHRISTTCKVFKVPVDNLWITFKVFISVNRPLLKYDTFKEYDTFKAS